MVQSRVLTFVCLLSLATLSSSRLKSKGGGFVDLSVINYQVLVVEEEFNQLMNYGEYYFNFHSKVTLKKGNGIPTFT